MIYVYMQGGLGNQFFQYAYGRKLQKKFGQKVKYITTSYKTDELRELTLNKFNINNSWIPADESYDFFADHKLRWFLSKVVGKFTYKGEDTNGDYYKPLRYKILNKMGIYYHSPNIYVIPEKKSIFKDIYVEGMWHNNSLFDDIRETLISEITLKEPFDAENQQIADKIGETEAVCVHIRRGDYLNYDYYQVCDLAYYERALNKMDSMTTDPTYFVFSDDIQWCKENLSQHGKEMVFVDKNNPDYIDIELMSRCKHFIISNSTFSWWAAYKSDYENKIVCTPDKWYKGGMKKHSLNVEGWIEIETFAD